MADLIAITNNKGGVGKTTTAVNIAGGIAIEYPAAKILIVDCDGQSNVAASFDLDFSDRDKDGNLIDNSEGALSYGLDEISDDDLDWPYYSDEEREARKQILADADHKLDKIAGNVKVDPENYNKTIYDVFMNDLDPAKIVTKVYDNIDIIPSNDKMNFLEFDAMRESDSMTADFIKQLAERIKNEPGFADMFVSMSANDIKEQFLPFISISNRYFNMLAGKFDDLAKKYDVIIFDTPPEIKSVTSSVLSICDQVIIPYEPESYAIRGLNAIMRRIKDVWQHYNRGLRIGGILTTKLSTRTVTGAEISKSVLKYAVEHHINFFAKEISYTVRYAKSTAFGHKPATIDNPENAFSQEYFQVVEQMKRLNVLTFDKPCMVDFGPLRKELEEKKRRKRSRRRKGSAN